jgi:hypothetical protein
MKMFAKSFDSQSVSGFAGMQETSAAKDMRNRQHTAET